MSEAERFHAGNAVSDGAPTRGWIIGHFIEAAQARHSEDVEIKWGVHPKGEERSDWQGDEHRTTVLLLVKGAFRLELSVGSVVLREEGDYALWGPGIGHSWRAEEDSVVITIRWPSMS